LYFATIAHRAAIRNCGYIFSGAAAEPLFKLNADQHILGMLTAPQLGPPTSP